MDQVSVNRLSKFLSWVLRHQPEAIGITLDTNGWTDISSLLQQAALHGHTMSRETLDHIVHTNSKQRFALDTTGTKIRASQGHTVDIALGLTPRQPPKTLYHGTAVTYADPIATKGILKQQRQHVHLSSEITTARQVGQRHGVPHIFRVDAARMYQDGFLFFLSDNGVWLTDHVPAIYLSDIDTAKETK